MNRKNPPLHPDITDQDVQQAREALELPSPTQLAVNISKRRNKQQRAPVDVKQIVEDLDKRTYL